MSIEEKEEEGNEQVQEVERESEQSQPETGARPRTKQPLPPPNNEEGCKSKVKVQRKSESPKE